MASAQEVSSPVGHQVGDALTGAEWSQIREALRGLRYGSVSIIVQDGVVVQIDRMEKRRIRRNEPSTNGNGNGSGPRG